MTSMTSARLRLIGPQLCALVGLGAVASGCSFSPSFPEGTIACSAAQTSSCPPGFSCVDGFCRSHVPDGSLPADAVGSDGSSLGADGVEAGVEAPVAKPDGKPTEVGAPLADGPPGDIIDAAPADTPVRVEVGAAEAPAATETQPELGSELGAPEAGSGKDSPDDTRDAGADRNRDVMADAPSCPTPCQPGDTRCGPGGGVQTCALVEGCPTWGAETACGGSKLCQGAAPTAGCKCPTPPGYCTGPGMACADASTLATCALDASQCLVGTTASCASSGLLCAGSFPNASCRSACPPTPVGCEQGVGSTCASTEVLTCSKDANGCYAATSAACPAGMLCGGSFPAAKCACPPVPVGCENGVARGCSGTDVVLCSTDANSCVHGTAATCSTNNLTPACSAGACAGLCNVGYADCNNDKQTDGCESHLTSDPAHCGSCSTACNPGVVCQNSTCAITRWGLSTGGTASTLSLGAGALAAMTVTISAANPNLVGLGAQTVTAGVKFRLGLYSNPSNAPSTLVAQTGELTSVANGQVEGYLTATAIPAGIYWLAVLSQSAIQIVAESTTTSYFLATSVAYGDLPTQFPASSAAAASKAHAYAMTSP